MTCAKCGKPAKHRYSPDLDIKGLGACEEHRDKVVIAFMLLSIGSEKEFKSFTKGWNIDKKA